MPSIDGMQRFIWSDGHGTGRNRFVLFRHRLEIESVPAHADLHLFADTRYRLWINGHVAGYGPARFLPSHPEFDTIDLAPWLQAGRNTILVEVNHRGANAFDAVPSIGGFIAWGRIGSVDLATPGAWRCRDADAWDAQSPCWSFAQGPIEICDTRALPPAWYHDGDDTGWSVPTSAPAAWGPLTARSIPPMDMAERSPQSVTLVAPVQREQRIGFRESGTPSRDGVRRRSVYALGIHSPRAQTVTLGLFWGPHFCNGSEVRVANHPVLGNRQDGEVELRAGWNLLYGEPEVMTESWPVLVAIPDGAGLQVSASERLDDPAWMRHAGPFTEDELAAWRSSPPDALATLPTPPGGWHSIARGHRPVVPAREAGWDRPGTAIAHPAHQVEAVTLPSDTADAVAVFDFAGEFHGHAVVELDAPAGCTLDIAIAERRRGDGLLALFKTHWITNEAERFILRGGPQRVEAFHQRGGRYLAVIVRGAQAPVTIRRVAVRDTLYPLPRTGRFACNDPVLTWVHAAGDATLRACMEDAFVDCPWRERGCYIGDALVQFHAARTIDADTALVRRTLRLFARDQRDDGLIHDVTPAWLRSPLLDYVYVWVMVLRDVWAVTGDTALVRELWPHVLRVFTGSAWNYNADGLVVPLPHQRVFIDWGVPRAARTGVSGPLNAFYAKALADAAELATVINAAEAAMLASARDTVRAAFQRVLWRPAAGAFIDGVVDGTAIPGPALHTNALALAFDLIPHGASEAVLRHLTASLDMGGREEGLLDTYAFSYLITGLYRVGQAVQAERAIHDAYAPMQAAGAWTLWENFNGGHSLCHAWSCAPMRFFHERVLGVRARIPGQPDDVLIAPESALAAASGIVPHPRGPIAIAWERHGEVLRLRLTAPDGVRTTVAPAGPLAGCRVVMA